MTEVVIDTSTNQEDSIKVSSRSDTQLLGGSISRALLDKQTVTLRAIGAAAVNQAVKATAVARGYVAQRGEDLVCRPGFVTTTDIDRPGTSGAKELSVVVLNLSTK